MKDRGWTEGLIKQFLGPPDSTYTNPHYRSSPPARLYLVVRVEQAEQVSAFLDAKGKAQVRRARGQAIAARKVEAMQAWVAALQIMVPRFDAERLCQQACAHYTRRSFLRATPADDQAFLQRITVNYLRHEMTDYEALLEQTFGRVGADEAHLGVARRVFAAIAEAYPGLADECARQVQRRLGPGF
jgi:hypothetical protein